jgi:phage shock protein C
MSIADQLNQLDELHRRGALSDDEFTRAKARALGGEGVRAEPPAAVAAINALRRSRDDHWLGGVCGGIARSTEVASWVWRLAFVLLALCGGTGVLLYLLMWVLVPLEAQPALRSNGAT